MIISDHPLKTKWNSMRLMFTLLLAQALLACAAGPPRLDLALGTPLERVQDCCRRVFPEQPQQFIHSIRVEMGQGKVGVFLGVTDIHPGSGAYRCAILTIEGLVLFEATVADGQPLITRGVPPFNDPQFAAGLLADIRLLFFKPEGEPLVYGVSESKALVCRYRLPDGAYLDIITECGDSWRCVKYSARGKVLREIQAREANLKSGPDLIPRQLQLIGRHPQSYSLNLNLLECVLTDPSI